MLELYYNFFIKFCGVNNFEELVTDTDSPYIALAEKELEDCIRAEKRAERLLNDRPDSFTADAVANSFPQTCVKNTNNMIRESQASSKNRSDVRRCYVCVVRHTVDVTSPLIKTNLALNVSTNLYSNRTATDQWKSIAESWGKR